MADEYTDCLLENKFHENCPGCKVYQMKRLRRGFPFTELLPIWIIVLGSSLHISSLFPFLYFMETLHNHKIDGDVSHDESFDALKDFSESHKVTERNEKGSLLKNWPLRLLHLFTS